MSQPSLAIDLGGSHATLAVVAGDRLLATAEVPMDSARDLRPSLDTFAREFRKLLAQLSLQTKNCLGVALGFCGLADARIGRVVSTNKKYEDAPGIDFPLGAQKSLAFRSPSRTTPVWHCSASATSARLVGLITW